MCLILSFFIISLFFYDIIKENFEKKNIIEGLTQEEKMQQVEGELNRLKTQQRTIINDTIAAKTAASNAITKLSSERSKIEDALAENSKQGEEATSGNKNPCGD